MTQTTNDDLQRSPDDWKTGDDPMTDAQRVYIDTLAGQAGEPTPEENLSKAQAAKKIEDLREKVGLDSEDSRE